MKPQIIAPDPADAVVPLDAGLIVQERRHGARAAMLARLTALGLPVPEGVALSFDAVRALAAGAPLPPLPPPVAGAPLVALRASPGERAWGGAPAILNIGVCPARMPALVGRLGERGALDLERRFVQSYADAVAGLDPGEFEALARRACAAAGVAAPAALAAGPLAALVAEMKALYARETDAAFPEDPAAQLLGAMRAMARAWQSASARILREAKGAPAEAGLGLVVQRLAFGPGVEEGGAGLGGTGTFQVVDARTGAPGLQGRFRRFGTGAEAASEEALAAVGPEILAALWEGAERAARGLGDALAFDFVLAGGRLAVLDAVPARRGPRAAVRIAVDLAKRGAITRDQAILRIEPRNLVEHLHPQIDPSAPRDVFSTGLAASPGAATGRIVFTGEAALAAAAQGEAAILVRVETGHEDIRGMHAAAGVLTIRGGQTSHAAVIARGIGLPCVVGASAIRLDPEARTLTTADGRTIREGAVVTVDGSRGEVLAGAPPLIQPELGDALGDLLAWADAVRTIGVRANADTAGEARTARAFGVDGIGLCRTEHMFFESHRISVMGEMILADTEAERRAALDRLLPMQRGDFIELFEIMAGLPVTIRLLDPPLHEFLPHGEAEMRELAAKTALSYEQVRARAAALAEFNPMLGMRGVRLGVVMPEIYEMQARAIFEAAAQVNGRARRPVVPEIMIPLVSANREAELVKARVDAVARAVEAETGTSLEYKIGVMVETPRAALRAGDLAASSAFLSFGTNDLTQMTYGLSRDDAGRFMRDYVAKGAFPEDPFHTLDLEGVGELMLMAARRGRASNPNLVLGLCGEHGGDPASVRFCKLAGFDYVSCSPYRVPIARLAAAQASILAGGQEPDAAP